MKDKLKKKPTAENYVQFIINLGRYPDFKCFCSNHLQVKSRKRLAYLFIMSQERSFQDFFNKCVDRFGLSPGYNLDFMFQPGLKDIVFYKWC